MQRLLIERDFDLAGVRKDAGSDVTGYAESTLLQHGKVRDHLVPFSIDVLVADSAPLTDLFEVLRDRTQVFVLVATKVSGIATRADLNKPAVRIYLFSLVSLLEMHMSFWIRSQYDGIDWKKELSEQRLQATVDLYEERRRRLLT